MEDAAEADAVLEDAVDLEDGVVGLLGVAVGHVVDVEHHLLHLSRAPHGPALRRRAEGGGGGLVPLRRDGVWGDGKAREGIEATGWVVACSCS